VNAPVTRRDDRDELLAAVDLAALLERFGRERGLEPRGKQLPCPAPDHEQTGRTPPATIATPNGNGYEVWHCAACGAGGTAIDAFMLARGLDKAAAFGELRKLAGRSEAPRLSRTGTAASNGAAPLPSETRIGEWAATLTSRTDLLERLRQLKGWTPEALVALGVGFDGERLTVPVRGGDCTLLNVCRYTPRPKDGASKMISLRGRPRDLTPAPETIGGNVCWVTEGEPDVISAASIGLTAVAVPGTEFSKRLRPERFRRFEQVNLLLDCDPQGREAAALIASKLSDAGIEHANLDLDPARNDGYDLGDLVREAAQDGPEGLGQARQLLERMAASAHPLAPASSPGVNVGETVPDVQGRRAVLTTASTIRTERIHWLWSERIPRRSLVVVAGEKGLGKSTLTNAYLVARLTRGELDGEFHGRPIDVAVATAEDDWRSVVVPRLIAHGADLSRVHRIDLHDADGRSLLTLPDDVSAVAEAIDKLRAATGHTIGMLVIDPITAFLSGGTDSHKDASVRRALFPLADLADQRDLAVLVVAHLKKDDSDRLLSRVSGSGAFVNAARAVLVFARNPDDPDAERGHERVLVMAATNWGRLAPSLAAHVETAVVQTDEGQADQPLLVIDGECEVDAGDLQRGAPDATGDEVADSVLVALSDEAREGSKVKDEVSGRLGVSRRTVERAAVRLEGDGFLTRDRRGFPAVAYWALSPAATTPVATTLDARPVATVATPANTRDSTSHAASSDNARCRVAAAPDGGENGRVTDADIEYAERVIAENGDES
jgi:hypothetical protein